MSVNGKFFMLVSCGEPVQDADIIPLYMNRDAAEEALVWYVMKGESMGFDDSATEIREVVVAPAVQNGMA